MKVFMHLQTYNEIKISIKPCVQKRHSVVLDELIYIKYLQNK